MELTPHQAKYFALELTRRTSSDDLQKLVPSLMDAKVDLNPHQVEAALFAFKSPLSSGAILADEVGLGKTIEAGLVISQKWAERKRKILIIVPSNLRKQWYQELSDKFFLPSVILEKRSYDLFINEGLHEPFLQDEIVICSYQFARKHEADIKKIEWDLVVIDEAHRLRNVHRASNKIANSIKHSISGRKKILLTATPLQNSLLELYGLVSILDDYCFGDVKSFKSQYSRADSNGRFDELKERLKPVCIRTLRRQVLEYIKYTNRIPITQEFYPTADEQALYDLVSEYLQSETLYALPKSQRTLMTLVLRKLLASSTFAIAGTLGALAEKLQGILERRKDAENALKAVSEDFETYEEMADEWDESEEEEEQETNPGYTEEELKKIELEKSKLTDFFELASSIEKNSKGEALLVALKKGFEELDRIGAPRKAIIFTESTRTQKYLVELLTNRGFSGKLVLFNGNNKDDLSRKIFQEWLIQHKGSEEFTGSKTADIRSALISYFQNSAEIMIATEAAAEGVNLQFCSLVVNYDLPWNPQRIEQRIGRCHRYGQKFDVVVVNFLNKANAADQKVYALLSDKFKLFEGVFGASDEVLGALESGMDFEKRIAKIYQDCRTFTEIESAFDELQRSLNNEIDSTLKDTGTKLLENKHPIIHRLEGLLVERAGSVRSIQQKGAKMCNYNDLLHGINNILQSHGITHKLEHGDISVTRNIIIDSPTDNQKLSNIIINHYWSPVNEAEVYHFTSREAAESICKTKIFRLTNIVKRYSDEEIKGFCEKYNLDGYLEIDTVSNEPKYKSLLMPELFYASFADTTLSTEEEEKLWQNFAPCDGVRIKFRIQATSRPDFRKIYYGIGPNAVTDLITELTSLANMYKLKFTFAGISKMCAFYLPSFYSSEKEYRLLIKNHQSSPLFPVQSTGYTFINIPLMNDMYSGYNLEILELCSNTQLNIPIGYNQTKRT